MTTTRMPNNNTHFILKIEAQDYKNFTSFERILKRNNEIQEVLEKVLNILDLEGKFVVINSSIEHKDHRQV